MRAPKFLCGDPTAEGLMRALIDGQYSQGAFSDEGGQFLGGHAMSDDAQLRTIAFLSRVWGGSPLDRARGTDSEYVVLYGRRVSLHLMVQPKVATTVLGSELYRSQGFLARFLVSAPDSLAGTRLIDPNTPQPDMADDPRVQRYWQTVTGLLERSAPEDFEVGGLSPSVLRLLPEARAFLIEAYNDIERAQAKGGDLETVREWAGKAAEHACRIAGVLQLTADPEAMHVTGETMRAAIELMRYYLGEYVRIVGASAAPEHLVRAQMLLDWLRKKDKREVTARVVSQSGPN